jgi:DNA polymerase-1
MRNRATPEAYRLFHDGSLALAKMEAAGIKVDVPYLEQAIKDVDARIKALDAELRESREFAVWRRLHGAKTNIDSLQQLGKTVYEGLGHKAHYTPKSYANGELVAKPRFKADEATLESVKLPFVAKYFEAFHLKKAKSTYLDGLLREVVDGYVHPENHLHTVRTFRPSGSNPNVKNQPVRNPEIGDIVRRAFVARGPKRRLVEVDCAAHEFRRAADFWQDPAMIEYASDPKLDPHRDAAADLFMCSTKQASYKPIRQIGKAEFVFPTLYGSWWKKIAANIWNSHLPGLTMADGGTLVLDHLAEQGITELGSCGDREEPEPGTFQYVCQQTEQAFMRRFPVFARKKEEWYQAYRKEGGFQTLTGFYCSGLYSKNETLNYPVQSIAYHIVLWCVIKLQALLERRQMRSLLVAEIYDCILADVPDSELQDYLDLIEKVMTRLVRKAMPWIRTPLDVEVDVTPLGGAWSDKAPWVRGKDGLWQPKQ